MWFGCLLFVGYGLICGVILLVVLYSGILAILLLGCVLNSVCCLCVVWLLFVVWVGFVYVWLIVVVVTLVCISVIVAIIWCDLVVVSVVCGCVRFLLVGAACFDDTCRLVWVWF